MGEEIVYYFPYISYKGGCLSSSSRHEYWIALPNKKVAYKAKVIERKDAAEKIIEKFE